MLMGGSVDACVTFLETLAPETLDEVWVNNIACRGIHVSLTELRPAVIQDKRKELISKT